MSFATDRRFCGGTVPTGFDFGMDFTIAVNPNLVLFASDASNRNFTAGGNIVIAGSAATGP